MGRRSEEEDETCRERERERRKMQARETGAKMHQGNEQKINKKSYKKQRM